MKLNVDLAFDAPASKHMLEVLAKRELILLDASKLIKLARMEEGGWLLKLMSEWQVYGVKAVCGICNFIEKEAKNAENWKFGRVTVSRFLKSVARRSEGMYISIKTPVSCVDADNRSMFYNLLPKSERRLLLDNSQVRFRLRPETSIAPTR